MLKYLFLGGLSLFLCHQALAEGNRAPPLDLAGPIPLPSTVNSSFDRYKLRELCKKNPCSPKCKQNVTCNDIACHTKGG